MTIDQAANFLYEIQLGDAGSPGCLRHLVSVVGGSIHNTVKYAVKDQVVLALSEYYCAPNRLKQIWNSLSDAERKIGSLHIWSNGSEPDSYADEIAKEFDIAKVKERRYYYYSSNGLDRFLSIYADKKSKLWLLFPRCRDNYLFLSELRNIVGEMERAYSKVADELVFSSRENARTDFSSIVRFCNSNKLAVTKSGIPTKSSALKLLNYCGYEEITSDASAKPEEMRTSQGLLVTFPLTVLCTTGGLLAIAEDVCIPGGKAVPLLNQTHEQLVKSLFGAYLKSKSFDEISVITGIKSKRGHHPYEARQNLASELMHCPAGQAVYTKEFERYLRITDRTFARRDKRYVIETGTSYYDSGVAWEQYEHPLIDIILSFFGALGIIDIAWAEEYAGAGNRVPIAFRINPLGAYVLGLADSYAASAAHKEKPQGGFTVLPDYTIVVPESINRVKHELFFERQFTKVAVTDQTSIYKLDFETIVRATNSGVSVSDVRGYLSASDKPLPENVARALDDWEKQVGRIRLRQVTILECEDSALLEEVIRYKGMGGVIKEKILAAVVVDGSATKEIKKVIEKNKRFCQGVL
jgi:hypothetical protein